jgi:rare lipoprotein A (peptidoglycan hydrolase)
MTEKSFTEGLIIDLAHGASEELNIDDDGEAVSSFEVLEHDLITAKQRGLEGILEINTDNSICNYYMHISK